MRVLLVLAFVFLGGLLRAEPFTLARSGKPVATIVTPAAANDREKLAAQELQRYVDLICGVKLPMREDGLKVEGAGLYIGRCQATAEADLPAPDLNPETYAIRLRGGDVFLTGRHPAPTYFAVISFIEDVLGVRWFAPGDLWEYVPQGKPGELVVDVREKVKVPDTSPRVWSGHAWTPTWKQWNLRNKTVLSEVVPRRQFQNFLHRVLPPEKYAQEHPEYYPLVRGKRWIPPPRSEPYWRPCESNPEVQRIVVEYARKWFDDHPDVDSFSLGMDDISHLCGCPNCRALDAHPDSLEKYSLSDRHYKFVNAIAREIARTHPDRYIGTLIYSCARNLPETVPKLEDNVFGFITEESASWWQEDVKRKDHELTREWARRCKHLSRYDYYGMGCITPRFYPRLMAEQLKFDKSLGLEGMYTEVYTFPANTAPMIWAFAKMQWDAALDVGALLDEYCARMFGPAAATMRRYFDLLERSWMTPRPGRTAWVHRRLLVQALAMSPEDVDEGFRLLAQAAAEAGSDLFNRRIDVVRAGLQYGSYPIKAYGLSQRLMAMQIADEAGAREALRLALELGRSADDRRRFWDAAMKRDDLLGETLRGLAGMNYLVTGQAAGVEGGAFTAVVNALSWYSANVPEKLKDLAASFAENAPPGEVMDLIKGWIAMTGAGSPNLIKNNGFESADKNQDEPEKDWKTAEAPKAWSVWSREGQAVLSVLPGKGRHGTAGASIAKASSACYLQNVPVNPGERYVCLAWAKREPSNLRGNAKLAVRFRQKNGGWHPRTDIEPDVVALEGKDGWQLLTLMVNVPEGAGAVVVMLTASDQPDGATALFDDAALYRLP